MNGISFTFKPLYHEPPAESAYGNWDDTIASTPRYYPTPKTNHAPYPVPFPYGMDMIDNVIYFQQLDRDRKTGVSLRLDAPLQGRSDTLFVTEKITILINWPGYKHAQAFTTTYPLPHCMTRVDLMNVVRNAYHQFFKKHPHLNCTYPEWTGGTNGGPYFDLFLCSLSQLATGEWAPGIILEYSETDHLSIPMNPFASAVEVNDALGLPEESRGRSWLNDGHWVRR